MTHPYLPTDLLQACRPSSCPPWVSVSSPAQWAGVSPHIGDAHEWNGVWSDEKGDLAQEKEEQVRVAAGRPNLGLLRHSQGLPTSNCSGQSDRWEALKSELWAKVQLRSSLAACVLPVCPYLCLQGSQDELRELTTSLVTVTHQQSLESCVIFTTDPH